jgi:hypothetical protein
MIEPSVLPPTRIADLLTASAAIVVAELVRRMLGVTGARVWAQMGNARRFSIEDL